MRDVATARRPSPGLALTAAAGLLLSSAAPVSGAPDPTVELVEITFDRRAKVEGRLAYMTGTIECDGTGWVRGIEISLVQRQAVGSTNESINPFHCSTAPTRYSAWIETEQRWHGGMASFVATKGANNVLDVGRVWLYGNGR
jgi:hypothetical protein